VLASRGYPALELAYFGVRGLPQELRDIRLEYFAAALRWLAMQPGVDPSRLVVLGASRGGEAALLIGATYPQLVHAVVAYVPSSVVTSACCSGVPGAAWTLGGRPIPYAGQPGVSDEEAAIPVERIGGPVRAIGGGFDALWPSGLFVQQIVARAREHGRADVVGLDYLTAGHALGVGVPDFPLATVATSRDGRRLPLGGSKAADARARAASWPKVLALLASLA
jgi:dienelactone hydrolase